MALLKVHLLKAVNVDYNFCQDSVSSDFVLVFPKFHHASLMLSKSMWCTNFHTQQEIFVKSGMSTKIRGKSKRWKEGKNNKLLCYRNQ